MIFFKCGQKAECEQILRDTLAQSQRALGPTYRVTQKLLKCMRDLGLVVRWATLQGWATRAREPDSRPKILSKTAST